MISSLDHFKIINLMCNLHDFYEHCLWLPLDWWIKSSTSWNGILREIGCLSFHTIYSVCSKWSLRLMADALEQKPFGEFTLDIYSQIIDKIDLANQPKLLMPISTITGAANLMAINSGIESESVRFGQLVSRHCICSHYHSALIVSLFYTS